jgi:hypothetical protein
LQAVYGGNLGQLVAAVRLDFDFPRGGLKIVLPAGERHDNPYWQRANALVLRTDAGRIFFGLIVELAANVVEILGVQCLPLLYLWIGAAVVGERHFLLLQAAVHGDIMGS